jgi:hypothetical protein
MPAITIVVGVVLLCVDSTLLPHHDVALGLCVELWSRSHLVGPVLEARRMMMMDG